MDEIKITIPISVGELLDKISILKIKLKYSDNLYLKREIEDLIKIAKINKIYNEKQIYKLFDINSKLWEIEEKLRKFEMDGVFDEQFVSQARLVYLYNDERSEIKREINTMYNSSYKEIKIYNSQVKL